MLKPGLIAQCGRQAFATCVGAACVRADAAAPLPAAGCGHCKRLVPEYTKLGEKIAADPKLKNRVLIAKVDADAHRELGALGLPADHVHPSPLCSACWLLTEYVHILPSMVCTRHDSLG